MRDHSTNRLFRYIAIDQTDLAPVQPGQESAALLPHVLARLNQLHKGTLLGTNAFDGLENHLGLFNSPIVEVPLIIETDEPIQLAGIFRSVMSGSGKGARLHVKEDTELTVLHWIDVGAVKVDVEGGLDVRKGRIGNLKAADSVCLIRAPIPKILDGALGDLFGGKLRNLIFGKLVVGDGAARSVFGSQCAEIRCKGPGRLNIWVKSREVRIAGNVHFECELKDAVYQLDVRVPRAAIHSTIRREFVGKAIQDSLRVRTVRNTVALATRARVALKERKKQSESAEQGSEKPNKRVHLRRGR
jgi:hypothetical protein